MKIWSKNQNCQFKQKFSTLTNSNIQNSMVMIILPVLGWKCLFLGKCCPKTQICQLKLKFGTWNNSNMQKSKVGFTFSALDRKLLLWKFGPKNQICQFKRKFSILTNSNMQKSMVIFTFSVLDWKYLFLANLVQKIKIVSLGRNLVPTIIHKIFETNPIFHAN